MTIHEVAFQSAVTIHEVAFQSAVTIHVVAFQSAVTIHEVAFCSFVLAFPVSDSTSHVWWASKGSEMKHSQITITVLLIT